MTFPPAHKEVSYRTWKHCAPSRISREVYEVSSASPKPLHVHVFLCELSIPASWQPIYLNCPKTKLSSPSLSPTPVWPCAHNDYIPKKFFNLSVKHDTYCILTGYNNISILNSQYRLLPLCAVDSNKTTTWYWAFANPLAYFPCKNKINVHQEPLLHKEKKLRSLFLHYAYAHATTVLAKKIGNTALLITKGSQRGSTPWRKNEEGSLSFLSMLLGYCCCYW